MGLFGIFRRKVRSAEQYAAELAQLEKDEEAAEAEEEKDVASERQLLAKLTTLYTKKVTVVQAQGVYFKAANSTVNAVGNLSNAFGNLFRKLAMPAKYATATLGVAATAYLGGNAGAAWNDVSVQMQQARSSMAQINKAFELEKAQSNPLFQNSVTKLSLIKDQKEVLATVDAILSREQKDIKKEAADAERIVEGLKKEREDLQKQLEELAEKLS